MEGTDRRDTLEDSTKIALVSTAMGLDGATPVTLQGPEPLHNRIRAERRLSVQQPTPAVRPDSNTRRLVRSLSHDLAGERGQGLCFLLIPVAMGVGAALALSAGLVPDGRAIFAVLLAAAMAAFLLRNRKPDAARLAALAAFACIGGLAACLEEARGPALLDSPVVTTLTGTIEATEITVNGRLRYRISLETTKDPEIRRPPAIVRLTAKAGTVALKPGMRVTGRARLAPPSGPALPGGYDFAYQAFFDGIGAYGFFFEPPETVSAETGAQETVSGNVRHAIRTLRENAASRIRSVLSGDAGGIAAALTVSDRSGISDETVDALRATGLAHILAISGLHMALAAGTLYVTFRRLLALSPRLTEAFPVKKLAAGAALLSAFAYLVLSGASVPTQRAFIMLAVMLGAVLIDRPALTMRNVALAAIIIILISPSAVSGPGFQMSFAATAALIAAYAAWPRRENEESRSIFLTGFTGTLLRGLGALAMTALVAGVATGLFSAHHFHRFAANGLISNVAAMPLVTFVVMPAGLVAMLVMPLGLDAVPLKIMGWGLELVIGVARTVESWGGDLVTGRLPTSATVIAASGFVMLVFLRTRLRLIGLVPVAAGLCMMVIAGRAPPPDLLISEDGRLVAAVLPGALAVNADKPSEFVFSQWQTALAREAHIVPVTVGKTPADEEKPEALRQLLEKSAAHIGEPVFYCAGRSLCAITIAKLKIAVFSDPALIATACDNADLAVLAAAVRLRACRSGALLVTARTLKETGALEIRFSGGENSASRDALDTGKGTGPKHDLLMTGAVQGIRRGWTMQRFYDWRSDAFLFPGEPPVPAGSPGLARETLPPNDSGGSSRPASLGP